MRDLTPRQLEVASLVAKGRTHSEIADILKCAKPTVASHTAHIYDKWHLYPRTPASIARYFAQRYPVERPQT